MEQEFNYITIPNWDKYQMKTRKGQTIRLYIKDFCDKDWDHEYSKLGGFTRYIFDGVCRLLGRNSKNIPNDPVWVARALGVIPKERTCVSQSIRVLVSCGLLALTNEQVEFSETDTDTETNTESDTDTYTNTTVSPVGDVVVVAAGDSRSVQTVVGKATPTPTPAPLGVSGSSTPVTSPKTPSPPPAPEDAEPRVAGYRMSTILEHAQRLIDCENSWVLKNLGDKLDPDDKALTRPKFVEHLMTIEPTKPLTKSGSKKEPKLDEYKSNTPQWCIKCSAQHMTDTPCPPATAPTPQTPVREIKYSDGSVVGMPDADEIAELKAQLSALANKKHIMSGGTTVKIYRRPNGTGGIAFVYPCRIDDFNDLMESLAADPKEFWKCAKAVDGICSQEAETAAAQ